MFFNLTLVHHDAVYLLDHSLANATLDTCHRKGAQSPLPLEALSSIIIRHLLGGGGVGTLGRCRGGGCHSREGETETEGESHFKKFEELKVIDMAMIVVIMRTAFETKKNDARQAFAQELMPDTDAR